MEMVRSKILLGLTLVLASQLTLAQRKTIPTKGYLQYANLPEGYFEKIPLYNSNNALSNLYRPHDSVHFYNAGLNNWILDEREHHSENLPTSEVIIDGYEIPTPSPLLYRTVNRYDQDGNLIRILWLDAYSTPTIDSTYLYEYEYQNGKQKVRRTYQYENAAWKLDSKTDFFYDQNGNETGYLRMAPDSSYGYRSVIFERSPGHYKDSLYYWDSQLNDWYFETIHIYNHRPDGRWTSYFWVEWENGTMDTVVEGRHYYTGNLLDSQWSSVPVYNWGAQTNQTRIVYSYNADNRLDSMIWSKMSNFSAGWYRQYKYHYFPNPGYVSKIQSPGDFEVSVFPNPASERIHIHTEQRLESIQAVDLQGRIVKDFNALYEGEISLDITGIRGSFILRVIASQKSENYLILREH